MGSPEPPRAGFVAAVPASAQPEAESLPELDGLLADLFRVARERYPQLEIRPEVFARGVGARMVEGQPLQQQLADVHASALYLTLACAAGDARAIATLEREFGSEFDAVVRKFGNQVPADDLWQSFRSHLFVAEPDQPPAIARYDGRGALGRWLRVTTMRIAINATRRHRPQIEPYLERDDFLFGDSPLADPELDHLKRTYQDHFRDAFVAAVQASTPREVTILRQTVVHGLSARELGRMYGVHHSSAARWAAQARAGLMDRIRARLMAQLSITPGELNSILALIESRLHLSVARVLGEADAPEK